MKTMDLPNDMDALCLLWRHAKESEVEATERRRVIEDKMNALIGLADTSEGVTSVDCQRFQIKVTHRLTRSVDAQELQAVAAEYGLSDHLSSLFRWKPEINMRLWKSADPSITNPLSSAITVKPGRPSFIITPKE